MKLAIFFAGFFSISLAAQAQEPELPIVGHEHGLRYQQREVLKAHKVKAMHVTKYSETEHTSGASNAKKTFTIASEDAWIADLEFGTSGYIQKITQTNSEEGTQINKFGYDDMSNLTSNCEYHLSFSDGSEEKYKCQEWEYYPDGKVKHHHPIDEGGYSSGNSGRIEYDTRYDYFYDDEGRLSEMKELSNVDYSNPSTELKPKFDTKYTYEGDRLVKAEMTYKGKPYSVHTYKYDAAGRPVLDRLEYIDGSMTVETAWTYDAQGNLLTHRYTSWRQNGDSPDSEMLFSYHYNDQGLLDRMAYDYLGKFSEWDWQIEYEFYD